MKTFTCGNCFRIISLDCYEKDGKCPACGFKGIALDYGDKTRNINLMEVVLALFIAATMAFHVFQINRLVEIVLWCTTSYCFIRYLRDMVRFEIQQYLSKSNSNGG